MFWKMAEYIADTCDYLVPIGLCLIPIGYGIAIYSKLH